MLNLTMNNSVFKTRHDKRLLYRSLQFTVPVLIWLAAIGGTYPVASSRPVRYTASARIWIQAQIPNYGSSSSDSQSATVYLPFLTFFNSPIVTSSEIIRSSAVVDQAVKILKARCANDRVPDEEAIIAGISTSPVKETDILVVRYDAGSAKVAADVLQAVLDGFIELSGMQSSATATKQRVTVETQLAQARKSLQDLNAKTEAFQKAYSISNMSENVETFLEEFSEARLAVHRNELSIARHKAEIGYIERRLSSMDPQAVSNSLGKALESKLALEQLQYLDLSQRLKETHPRMKKMKKMIEQTQQAVAGIRAGSGEDWRELSEKLVVAKQELGVLTSEYVGNKERLLQLEKKQKGLPAEVVQWTELERQRELETYQVSKLEARLKEASLLESISQGTTNIKIIDKASVANVPSGPSKGLMLGVAAVGGAILAGIVFILFYYFDPFVSRLSQVRRFLSAPVAGAFSLKKKASTIELEALSRAVKRNLSERNRILIVSPVPNSGVEEVSEAFSKYLASNQTPVLLIDANQWDPQLHAKFGQPLSPGLAERDKDSSVSPVQSIDEFLGLVTPGKIQGDRDLYDASVLNSLLHDAKNNAGVEIFCCPPANVSSRYLNLASEPALIFVVIRFGETMHSDLARIAAGLKDVTNSLVLLVISDAKDSDLIEPVLVAAPAGADAAAKQDEPVIW